MRIDMPFNDQMPLSQLKLHSQAYYKRLGSVDCSILDEKVHFTAEGYFHLINESNSKPGKTNPRNPAEQYMKLKYLPHVKAVLKYSTLIDDRRKNRKKVKGKWKDVIQTEIIHEIKGTKISVIVEKVGDGNSKFLSVFPSERVEQPQRGLPTSKSRKHSKNKNTR
jgi:hypothetical protein